jgi:hypothetical protein
VYAIVLIIVTAAATAFVGGEVVGNHGIPASRGLYSVSFMNATESLTGTSGTAPQISATNLTNVTFIVTWQDQSFSPLTNPVVTVTVTGPNGTGTATDRVTTSGMPALSVTVTNVMPANSTVEAGSPEEALAMANANNNATLGTGEWTVSLQVGNVIGPRPGGSISYSISVEVEYFVGTATRA